MGLTCFLFWPGDRCHPLHLALSQVPPICKQSENTHRQLFPGCPLATVSSLTLSSLSGATFLWVWEGVSISSALSTSLTSAVWCTTPLRPRQPGLCAFCLNLLPPLGSSKPLTAGFPGSLIFPPHTALLCPPLFVSNDWPSPRCPPVLLYPLLASFNPSDGIGCPVGAPPVSRLDLAPEFQTWTHLNPGI